MNIPEYVPSTQDVRRNYDQGVLAVTGEKPDPNEFPLWLENELNKARAEARAEALQKQRETDAATARLFGALNVANHIMLYTKPEPKPRETQWYAWWQGVQAAINYWADRTRMSNPYPTPEGVGNGQAPSDNDFTGDSRP